MKISKYIKVDPNVLLEYVYDDSNLIGESYEIGLNIKNSSYNYTSNDLSGTLNTTGNTDTSASNTLFPIDVVNNVYGIFNTKSYSFLQLKRFGSGFPIRHDTINIRLPINYTFGEYIGIFLKVYAFDTLGQNTYDLSNFFFDITDLNQKKNLNYVNPPIFFQQMLWGKVISLYIPSLFAVSSQRANNVVQPNSINYNLTNGVGLNQNSPIFIDFHFITNSTTINSVKTYTLTPANTLTLPQTPDFEKIGVIIEESSDGDFFDIYGTYSGDIGDFNTFMNNSVSLGNRYYVQYTITMYEQNIRVKSLTVVVMENFLSKVEYRPIIKYSTTTAIIDVKMDLIDAVDSSTITRQASFGMLQDQVSKYGLSLMKINLSNANVPKIYNIKNSINLGSTASNLLGSGGGGSIIGGTASYPVLVSANNVVSKSDNAIVGTSVFYGIGNLVIVLYPFDNVVTFVIASQINSDGGISFMDLTSMGIIQLTIKSQSLTVSASLYVESGSINLASGYVSFKIVSSKVNDIRKIYNSGINIFYITSTQQSTTTVIYSGLFQIYDSPSNVTSLNISAQAKINELVSTTTLLGTASSPPSLNGLQTGTAIVTRTLVPSYSAASNIVIITATGATGP
jgi:hypothetical protein